MVVAKKAGPVKGDADSSSDSEGEEEEVAPAAEDDTLSLSDIAEEEASLEDDAETE